MIMAQPAASAAATTSASFTLPPGCTMAVTPALMAASTPSGKGKNASDASTLPFAAAPAFSLLRLSSLARCGGALIVIAGLWAMVFWALA